MEFDFEDRTRTNLKNPSTTVDAESSPLQLHQRTRGPTTDGAARKRSDKKKNGVDFTSLALGPFCFQSSRADEGRGRARGGCVPGRQACTVGELSGTIRVISQHLSQNFRGLLNAMSSCACDSTVSDLALLKVLTGPAVLPMLCGLRNRMARPAASPRRHAALRNRHRTRSPTCTTAAYCAWTPAEAAALITSTAAASVRERSSCNLAERLATCALSRARSSAASWS